MTTRNRFAAEATISDEDSDFVPAEVRDRRLDTPDLYDMAGRPRRPARTDADAVESQARPRQTRPLRRTASQAFSADSSDVDSEANDTRTVRRREAPQTRRRLNNTAAAPRLANSQAASSQNEPIVIDDLDTDVSGNERPPEEQQLREALQRQREEQVQALTRPEGANDEPPRLNKLQCVICIDSFTDMTATSCGHIFCHSCLLSAMRAAEGRRHQATGVNSRRSQCPVCRTMLNRGGGNTRGGARRGNDVIPLLIMKKGAATQPRGKRSVGNAQGPGGTT